ncbi:putative poly(A) polymerase [Halobacteriovorax marinus SJ]|uniref:Poly(A) polymerase n=1 Tax=Halobacteriovorax marinus (strain ATCC BAA-682 / DSM 15412 / SJ) TaxID=862908 RepID=E1X367_HALMS|nr:poly(A) polymerase [Halobacteriovorax marinus]CBW26897.1 putative poly(A) polymerase [Halobacteriovorax marinus SJ]
MLVELKNALPAPVLEFNKLLNDRGFKLTLIGGAVRDFILYSKLSDDLDFEIRSQKFVDDAIWPSILKDLFKEMKPLGVAVESLKFNIYRVTFKGIEFEISSPRKEVYEPNIGDYGHSDFRAEFSSNFTYEESFARRDFTLNAIGVEFTEEFSLIDPYGGVEAAQKRELDFITDDFFKDPVRLLRTLRFKVAHNLTLSRRIKDDLVYFNLNKLSLHYFVQEGRKIGLENLAYEMDFSRRKFALKLPSWAEEFSKFNFKAFKECYHLVDLVLYFSTQREIADQEVQQLATNFNIKKTTVNDILNLREFYLVELSKLEKDIANDSFDQFCARSLFLKLARLKKGVNRISPELIEFYLSSSLKTFLFEDFVESDLYREILPTIKRSEISMLGIYCHLLKK